MTRSLVLVALVSSAAFAQTGVKQFLDSAETHNVDRRITIERPLRLSWQFSDERIATLRFAPGALNGAMQWLYAEYGQDH